MVNAACIEESKSSALAMMSSVPFNVGEAEMAQKQWSAGSAGGEKVFRRGAPKDAMAGMGSKKVGGAKDGSFKPPAKMPKDGGFKPPASTPVRDLTGNMGARHGKGTGRGSGP